MMVAYLVNNVCLTMYTGTKEIIYDQWLYVILCEFK